MCINTLNDLLEKPFKCFTKEEQLKIAKRGRFTDLVDLSQNDKGKYRMFAASWYQRVKWLSGNTVNRKLYCWNCVLYPSGPSRLWNTTGFDDLRNLSQATKKHEESKDHIYSTVKLRILCKSEKPADDVKNQFEKNVMVKRNREYLERLIDISVVLALEEIPFRHEDGEDGLYKNLLILLRKYDDTVRTKVEQDSQFKGFTKTIQIDLVQSIAHVIRQRIAEEVAAANFFSLMVDEVTCHPSCKQISVVIRYVRNGGPVERFIGLYEVGYGTRAAEVMAILEKELERFNYKDKMVSQSYDGAVVKPTELYSLQQAVKRQQSDYCQAQFIYCYRHEFSSLLAQSLRSVQECKLFFSVISLFCTFFRKIQIKDVLLDIPAACLESVPRCIVNVKSNYETFLRVLEIITTSANFEHSMDVVADAVNLINHLKSYKFMIFLTMFDKYFRLIDQTFESVKANFSDTKFYRKEVNKLIEKLKKFKAELEFQALIKDLTISGPSSTVINMFALNTQILDNIIHDIEGRTLDIELTDFFGLVTLDNFPGAQSPKRSPDSALLVSIRENYPKFFDMLKLRTELDLFYADPTIGGIGECEINKISDISKFFYDNDIKAHLSELYKLLELVVVMPSPGEALKGPACALNRIKSYCNSEKEEEPRSALALLSIERELLVELQNSSMWYSLVIDHFATLPTTSSIELMYKNSEPSKQTKVEVITEPELTIKAEPDLY